MRHSIIVLTLLIAGPAAAQQWVEYRDAKRGIIISLPAEFKDSMRGLAYLDASTDRGVIVWSGDISTTFVAAANDELSAVATKSKELLSQSVTSEQAAYSAIREDGRRVDARMIPSCYAKKFVGFQAVYPTESTEEMKAVVERIASSFRADACE